MAESRPEVWLRGPVAGVPAALQPVAHSLLQVQEEMHALLATLPTELLWQRPGGAAAIGFHVLHLAQATDRLFTYARGEQLADAQRAALRLEKEPTGEDAAGLLRRLDAVVAAALAELRGIEAAALDEHREVGGQRLPATVRGLLLHAGEHAYRHAGQATTTAKVLRGQTGSALAE